MNSPPNSYDQINSLLQQLQYSQQIRLHSFSVLTEEVSCLKATLTTNHLNHHPSQWPSSTPFNNHPTTITSTYLFNHGLYTHYPDPSPTFTPSLTPSSINQNTTHTFFQKQSSVTQSPFYHQQPLKFSPPLYQHVGLPSHQNQTPPPFVPPQTAPPSFHHAQHGTLTDEPTLLNTKPSPGPVFISHKPSHHYQPQTISTTATVQFSSPTVISETNTVKAQEPMTDSEINLTIVHENELVVATKFVEPENNETKESQELMVVEGDFTHFVDSVSKVDEEEMKRVLDLVAISDPESDFIEEQKRDVIKDLKTFFFATASPSMETKVLRGVAMAETPSKPSRFFFNLSDFHIHIFDPGRTLTITAFNTKHRHSQIQNFSIFIFYDSDIAFIFEPNGALTDAMEPCVTQRN